MGVVVGRVDGGHRLVGDGPLRVLANHWLAHLEARCFSPATVRSYAFDLLNLSRFLEERGVGVPDVGPTDFFEWLEWQGRPAPSRGRRVPSPRRSAGVRSPRRGLLGHVEGRRAPAPRRLVRQDRRLPESLAAEEVGAFLADLETHRDRAVVLLMLLGGLRAAGPVAAAGGCRHGHAPGQGAGQGQQGAHRPGRSGLLQRTEQLPAP